MAARMLCSALVIHVWLSILPCAPRSETFKPKYKPVLHVKALKSSIHVDGDLGDSGWKGAVGATGFTEVSPGDQVKPQVKTEVLVTYDPTHLYVAFIAYDDPASIRASLRARDQMYDDDYVGIIIDTYDNAAWAYELFANPLGIQGDERWTPSGEDVGFDVVFDSEGKITGEGYQVEMAIPFKSLRFPDREEQIWRVTFWRNHPRDSKRLYSWAAISRDEPCFPCQFGTLVGFHNVRPGRSLEFLPALIGSQAGELKDLDKPHSGFRKGSTNVEGSLGVRYGITSSMGAELTINPDFSQVESDVAQIDVNTTFALFFPERRPFFQEGSDLFQTWWNAVYTRTINDPSFAAKAISRTENTSLIALAARDEHTPLIIPLEERSEVLETGKSSSAVLRVRRALKEDSYIGAVATSRWYDGGGSGSLGGIDAMLRFKQNYEIKMQGLFSITREPERSNSDDSVDEETFDRGAHTVVLDGEYFNGHGGFVSFERDARHWKSSLDYWDSSPTFRADNGFVFRNNERKLVWANAYIFYPDNKWLDQVKPNFTFTRRWNSFSVRKAQSLENWLEVLFKRQTLFSIGYDFYSELFRNVYFDDIRLFYTEVSSAFSEALQFGAWLGLGDRIARNETPPILGEGAHVDAWAKIKPLRQLAIEPLFMYSMLSHKEKDEKIFEGYIFRTRINYQLNRELFLRLVVQYDDFTGEMNVEPLLTYQLNPFSVFYVGSGSSYLDYSKGTWGFRPSRWQVFFKFQYFYRL